MKRTDFIDIKDEKEEEIKRLKIEINRLKKELLKYKEEAYIDCLTKLHNRRILENIKDFDIVIIGDVDYFKNINDTYGHIKGDEVLIEISRVLIKNVESDDIVCRFGGEEFVILLKNSSEEEAIKKAEILRKKINRLSELFGFNITMSFGISNFISEQTVKSAIKNADKALYKSKRNGRNKVTMYD